MSQEVLSNCSKQAVNLGGTHNNTKSQRLLQPQFLAASSLAVPSLEAPILAVTPTTNNQNKIFDVKMECQRIELIRPHGQKLGDSSVAR